MKKGFSLIELMVVVAIIAILAAVAVPAYNAYIMRSKVLQAYTATQSITKAIQEHYDLTGNLAAYSVTIPGAVSAGSNAYVPPTSSYIYAIYYEGHPEAATPWFVLQTSLSGTGDPTVDNLYHTNVPTYCTVVNSIWKCACGGAWNGNNSSLPIAYLPPSCAANASQNLCTIVGVC